MLTTTVYYLPRVYFCAIYADKGKWDALYKAWVPMYSWEGHQPLVGNGNPHDGLDDEMSSDTPIARWIKQMGRLARTWKAELTPWAEDGQSQLAEESPSRVVRLGLAVDGAPFGVVEPTVMIPFPLVNGVGSSGKPELELGYQCADNPDDVEEKGEAEFDDLENTFAANVFNAATQDFWTYDYIRGTYHTSTVGLDTFLKLSGGDWPQDRPHGLVLREHQDLIARFGHITRMA